MEALKLPAWPEKLRDSSWDKTFMFRGNPTHTFYGTGSLRDTLEIQWSHRMIDFHTTLRGRKVTWRGTGWTGQPISYGGYIFVGSVGRSFYAFDAQTGAVRWRLEGKRMFKSSPCFYQNRIYVACVDDLLRCIDASTGRVIWAAHMLNDCDSSPCVVDDKVYICGESGHARCLDPRSGTIIWETYLGGTGPGTKPGSNGVGPQPSQMASCLLHPGRLFCVDIKTGRVKWTTKTGDDTDAFRHHR